MKIEKASNIEVKTKRKLFRTAIAGLTLVWGLSLTACGNTKVDKELLDGCSYEEYQEEFGKKYKTELSEADKEALAVIADWNKNIKVSEAPFDYTGFVNDVGEERTYSVLVGSNDRLFKAVSSVEDILVKKILEEVSENLPKGVSYIGADNCSIKADYDSDGVFYYIEIQDVNAFSSDNNVTYKARITDKRLVEVLDLCNAAISKGYSKLDFQKYDSLYEEFACDGLPKGGLFSETLYSKDKMYEAYTAQQLVTLYNNLYETGSKLMLGLQTIAHSDFKFGNWEMDRGEKANQYKLTTNK